jgi:hypothetical protein
VLRRGRWILGAALNDSHPDPDAVLVDADSVCVVVA